jgi:hypothetical protein
VFDWLVEQLRVVIRIPRLEWGRQHQGPAPMLVWARRRGACCATRTVTERARLRRAISRIDAHMPGGGNCYRRALLEIALDPDAAAEPLFMGLHASGQPMSGHAWLGIEPRTVRKSYDAIISL